MVRKARASGATGDTALVGDASGAVPTGAPARRPIATSVQLREVMDAGLRLDASAFSIPAREAMASLRASGMSLAPLFGPGGAATEAQSVTAFRERVYVEPGHGVPFLTSSDIISMRPEVRRHLSRRTRGLDTLTIKKWDVLVSCSGTIGNVGFAGETLAGHALSQDAIRVRATGPEESGFLAAFLLGRYGRLQLLQATYGSVIVHIEPAHLERVLVPAVHPIKRVAIGRAFVDACNARDEANRLIDEADRLLHHHLALPYLPARERGGVRPISVRASALDDRLEAAYHNPTAGEAEVRLHETSMPLLPLGASEVAREVRAVTRFRERVYVRHGGIPLLNSKQLFQLDPIDVKGLAKGAHLADLPEIQLRHEMVLVTCSGTIGRVQIVPQYMADWTASQDAHRVLASDDMNPGFLYAWLGSDYGTELVRRHTYGSVVVHIDREQLAAVPVPMPPAAVRNEVGDLVLRANALRHEAWRLERTAIADLERLIQRSGG